MSGSSRRSGPPVWLRFVQPVAFFIYFVGGWPRQRVSPFDLPER